MAKLQTADFDVGAETDRMVKKNKGVGAAVSFLGVARDFSRGEAILKLEFEHYPGMAEKGLEKLEQTAIEKFDILDISIVHRIGPVAVNENIVLIVVTSAHRAQAFDACEWAIDELKRSVPIWKLEFAVSGKRWVEEHP